MADAEMAGHATEQPAVAEPVYQGARPEQESQVSLFVSPIAANATGRDLQMEIHVAFNNGMWWAMPHELSNGILEQWHNGAQEVSFIWDWHGTRPGSYQTDGANTSLNRYIIDFGTMQQRNIDNNRTRRVKVVYVLRC
jgi:hypothetical protein